MKNIRPAFGLLAALMLSGCGNAPETASAQLGIPLAKQLLVTAGSLGHRQSDTPADPTANPALRNVLVQAGTPFYGVAIAKVQYISVMAPYGQNGPVQTWASGTHETISLKDGILVATRGFGNDMMTSIAPNQSQISSAVGAFRRVYYYLDGGDQSKSLEFDCTYAKSGAEALTILGLSYDTHRVSETCANRTIQFENVYWFDSSNKLRQSLQFVSPELVNMRLQRLID